jgi:LPPG:FO 2-phospho-L-lactate transferase
MAALEKADLVVLAPSNPFVSIDPILNVYPIRAMIADIAELVVAVSPIVGGAALKGPAAKMLQERGLPVSPQAIVDYYGDLIDVFVYDRQDQGEVSTPDRELLCTDTIMRDRDGRARLASQILAFTQELVDA